MSGTRGQIFVSFLIFGLYFARTINSQLDEFEPRNVKEVGEWLEDETNTDKMLSDQPMIGELTSGNRCPSRPHGLVQCTSASSTCSVDEDCSGELICCDNGCIMTCVEKQKAPAVVDWLGEAPKILQSESSNPYLGAECSTSDVRTDDSDPLLCPEDMYCLIEDNGDTTRNIDNRGRCIPIHGNKEINEPSNKEKESDSCPFHGIVYKSRTTFFYDGHICTCNQGSLSCYVANGRNQRDGRR